MSNKAKFQGIFLKKKLCLELRKTDFVKCFPKSFQIVKHTMEAVEPNIRVQPGKNEGIAKTFLSYQKFLNKNSKKKIWADFCRKL